MGGTVALCYLETYGSAKVDTFVSVGTPFLGSDYASDVLAAGDDPSPEVVRYCLGGMLSGLPEGVLEDDSMKLIFNLAMSFIRTMPSIYMLTPEESYKRDDNYYIAGNMGSHCRSFMKKGMADAFSSVKIVNVIGSGSGTMIKNGDNFATSADGDGVVTTNSATAGGLLTDKTNPFAGVSHSDLVKDFLCVCYICDSLRN